MVYKQEKKIVKKKFVKGGTTTYSKNGNKTKGHRKIFPCKNWGRKISHCEIDEGIFFHVKIDEGRFFTVKTDEGRFFHKKIEEERLTKKVENDTVLSRGVWSLFWPTRKSSPWGNFFWRCIQSIIQSFNHSINQSIDQEWQQIPATMVEALRSRSFRVIDWLIDDKLTLIWLVYWILNTQSVVTGAGLKRPNNTVPCVARSCARPAVSLRPSADHSAPTLPAAKTAHSLWLYQRGHSGRKSPTFPPPKEWDRGIRLVKLSAWFAARRRPR